MQSRGVILKTGVLSGGGALLRLCRRLFDTGLSCASTVGLDIVSSTSYGTRVELYRPLIVSAVNVEPNSTVIESVVCLSRRPRDQR